MRATFLFSVLALAIFTGCGNGNDARTLGGKKSQTTSTLTATNAPLVSLEYCQNFVPYGDATSAMFNGASICKIKGNATMVRVKTGANFPISSRFCLVPMSSIAFRESCFTINGQADIALDPAVLTYGYGSVAFIAEGNVAAYRAFLSYASPLDPPRGIALMGQ